jgi:hypothetical protein
MYFYQRICPRFQERFQPLHVARSRQQATSAFLARGSRLGPCKLVVWPVNSLTHAGGAVLGCLAPAAHPQLDALGGMLPALGAGGGHHSRALAVEDTRAVHPSIYCLVGKRIKSVPLP